MGKPKLFVINLSGNNLVYFAGSSVNGSVLLELSEPIKTKEVSIVLSGKAYVHWREENRMGMSGNRTVLIDDTAQIIFNDRLIQLWGNGRDSQELAAGRYEFPFNFQLPSNGVLPKSFVSEIGYIRYSLLARIHRQSPEFKRVHTIRRGDYITVIRDITVDEIVDINTAQLTTPLLRSNEKTFCCLCCTCGPISLSAKTDRGGYCPGESIAISTEVENHSNRRITCVRATLKQEVVYYAGGYSRASVKIIQRTEGPRIELGATSNWSIPIPAAVPSISRCRILKLSYVLTITLDIPDEINDLHVAIPITIGNVPFRAQGEQSTSVGYRVSQNLPPPPSAPPYPPVDSSDESFNYSTASPPVNIGLDNDTMGETQFAPVHGFITDYQFAPPPSYAEATAKVKGEETYI